MEDGGESTEKSAESPMLRPVFFENPDGTLVQGVPVGYKERTPPSTPRAPTVMDFGLLPMSQDIVRALARHEAVFLCLLFTQFVAECTFEAIHALYSDDAVFELSLMYPTFPVGGLSFIYWSTTVAECFFSCAYLALGVVVACRGSPRPYQRFAAVALAGTLGQLPLGYLNRFNLLVFLLRFISYAYARFQCNLLRNLHALYSDALLL
mmetsp:Transcript_37958/g.109503  ORF Transcript_37958/g.109503 Transcript_37958/m.109503 type:complete len:208 (-) Transcript_37958:96-719(-)